METKKSTPRRTTTSDKAAAQHEAAAIAPVQVKTLHDIETMDPADLITWLVTHKGFRVKPGVTDDQIRAACAVELGIDYAPEIHVSGLSADQRAPENLVTIFLYEGGPEDKETHVFVNVNGRTALIKRGQTVRLPKSLLPALQDARTIHYTHNPETQVTTPHERHTYPFSLSG